MKKLLFTLLTLICLFAMCDLSAANNKKDKKNKKLRKAKVTEVKWETSLRKALTDASKNKKQIFLILTDAKSFEPYEEKVFKHKNISKVTKRAVLMKFNPTPANMKELPKEEVAMWKGFKYMSKANKPLMPTVYLLEGNGTILEKVYLENASNPENFINKFKKFRKK